VWGGFAGAAFEWRTGRVALFASAEYLALSDSSAVGSGPGRHSHRILISVSGPKLTKLIGQSMSALPE
jgi:hypothetical protein